MIGMYTMSFCDRFVQCIRGVRCCSLGSWKAKEDLAKNIKILSSRCATGESSIVVIKEGMIRRYVYELREDSTDIFPTAPCFTTSEDEALKP